jgi:lethal(2) giant larvae protein
MGSSVIRYSISLPHPDNRLVNVNTATPVGKDYALLHAAPVVAVFILDHSCVPVPCPYEVQSKAVPAPDMHSPHFALICTQEQLKLVNLPGMKQKKKEKVSELIQERILRAWIVRIKVPAAPIGANRDWNSAVAILTSGGNLMAYSLPDLRNCFNYNELVVPTDHKAMQSVSLSANGEVLFLKSDSELERSLISSYGFSYHTTMLPNIFPFEGSTGPAQQPTPPTAPPDPVCEVTVEVTMEQEAENEEKRSRRSQTPSPEEPRPPPPVAGPGTSPKKKKKSSKSKRRSRESKESSVPRPRSPPSGTAISEGAGGGGVNGILASPERNGGTEVSEGKWLLWQQSP